MKRQQRLWESPTFEAVARVRVDDPETSHAGARHIEKKVTGLRALMIEAFRTLGAATANEAAEFVVKNMGGSNHESLRKRAKELQRAGLIWTYHARKCEVTGQPASVYQVRQ